MGKSKVESLPPDVRQHVEDLAASLADIAAGSSKIEEAGVTVDHLAQLAAGSAAAHAPRPQRAALGGIGEPMKTLDLAQVVSARVRDLRNHSGFSQERLAQAMERLGFGWRRITVAEVEGGARRLSLEELLGLAVLFSVPVVELLTLNYDEEVTIGNRPPLNEDEAAQLITGLDRVPRTQGSLDWDLPKRVARITGEDWRPASALWALLENQRRMMDEAAGRNIPAKSRTRKEA